MRIGEALLVEIFFHPGDADIVGVYVTQNMRGNRAIGVDSHIFRREADAGKTEVENLRLLLRRHMPLDPDEAFLRAETLAQLFGVDVRQHRGDHLDGFVLVDNTPGFGEDRHGFDVGGEHVAVAVDQVWPGA